MNLKPPSKVLGIVMEWASINQEALIEDWQLAEQFAELKKIPPLE